MCEVYEKKSCFLTKRGIRVVSEYLEILAFDNALKNAVVYDY
jgi:hypothetical protein